MLQIQSPNQRPSSPLAILNLGFRIFFVGGSVFAIITMLLAVAGLSLGKDLPMLKGIGWKIIPVGIVAIVASFLMAAVIAEFALGMWHF